MASETPWLRRTRGSLLPSCSGLRASSMAFAAGGPAAWDALPRGFALGAGPTIVQARGRVSCQTDDSALVAAAGRGDTEEVQELLQRASSPNVLARRPCDRGGLAPATTALHAAAASGELSTVQLLLDSGADAQRQQSGLRRLTPLHEAATVAVAELLLAAGACPTASDPREPDPAWYHKQRGRNNVAEVIATAAAAAAAAAREVAVIDASPNSSSLPKLFPCMTSAEITRARRAWGLRGAELCAMMRPQADSSSTDIECAVCMTELFKDRKSVV